MAASVGAPVEARQCLRYDVTGWYWVLDRDGHVVKIDTLDDPHAIGAYAFATTSVIGAGSDELEAVRAAYLTSKRLRKAITDEREWHHIRFARSLEPRSLRS